MSSYNRQLYIRRTYLFCASAIKLYTRSTLVALLGLFYSFAASAGLSLADTHKFYIVDLNSDGHADVYLQGQRPLGVTKIGSMILAYQKPAPTGYSMYLDVLSSTYQSPVTAQNSLIDELAAIELVLGDNYFVGDYDGDGDEDVLILSEHQRTAVIVADPDSSGLQIISQHHDDQLVASLLGHHSSVSTVDHNGDGADDMLVYNTLGYVQDVFLGGSSGLSGSNSKVNTLPAVIASIQDFAGDDVSSNVRVADTVVLSAQASDTDGVIKHVSFYLGNQLIETQHVAPYEYLWIPTEGQHTFRVVAEDNEGAIAESTISTNLVTDPLASASVHEKTQYTYTESGQLQRVDGLRDDVADITRFEYDSLNNLSAIENALGQRRLFQAYNEQGKPAKITDENGVVTNYSYSPRGWLLSVTRISPDGDSDKNEVTTYIYNSVGLVTKTTLPTGAFLQYTYDAARRVTATENSLGERIEYTLDAAGNRTGELIKAGDTNIKMTLSRTYDELNRVIGLVNSTGQTTAFTYDANGNRLSDTNALNHTTSQSVDALNRVELVMDALNQNVTYAYDSQDRITSVIDPRGVQTNYGYDAFDNLVSQTSPDTGTATFTYDAAGNLLSKIDARGISTQYQYDALNRLVSITHPSSPTLNKTYTYDSTSNGNQGVGHLTSIQDGSGGIDYVYDHLGRIATEVRTIDGVSYTNSYSYDKSNQIISQQSPIGISLNITRNIEGKITGLSADYPTTNGVTTQLLASGIAYLPYGPMTGLTYGNGITLNRSFDQDYRLTQQAVSGIETLDYAYNPVNSITAIDRIQEPTKSQEFEYDALQRLTREDGSEGSKDYIYDAVSNRTQRDWLKTDASTDTQSISYASDSNKIATEDGVAVIYDAVGNITQRSSGLGLQSFFYDDQARLNSVHLDGQEVIANGYNSLGQRDQKLVTVDGESVLTVFHYGLNGKLLGESVRDADTGKKTRSKAIVWLEEAPIAQLVIHYSADESIESSKWFYLHPDHLNTPRVASDTSQSVVWRWESDAFGLGEPESDPDGNGELITINLRFPGQYYDKETGYYYNYYRDYDPSLGRYIQSDPIGLLGGLNTYGYVYQNPLIYIDPYGLDASGAVTVSVNAGIGVGVNGKVTVSSSGVSGYVGVGVGVGLGVSVTGGVKGGNSEGFGVSTSVSANAGAGPGVSGNITSGTNGASGFGGVGVGLGAGATATIGIGGPIITWPTPDSKSYCALNPSAPICKPDPDDCP